MDRREAWAGTLAVVIVSYNVAPLLRQCLESVQAEAGALTDDEVVSIWVVDNASADGSADMVERRFPKVHLMRNAQNRGFAAANNQALNRMGFDIDVPAERLPRYVLLLNPDTTLAPGALKRWLAEADALPRAGVVGPSLCYPDGHFQHSAFAFPTLWQIFFDFFPLHHRLSNSRLNGRYPRAWYERGEPFPVGHPLGAAMLVRREAILDTGLLDEGYFIYAEEVDWCLRMRQRGWEAWCAPAVRVVHHEAQSTRQFRDQMFTALWKSRFRLFARHYGPAFNWTARRLVRMGLRKMRREALRTYRAGRIDYIAYEKHLSALREVDALSRLPAESFL